MQDLLRELLLFASMKKKGFEIKPIKIRGLIDSACLRLNYLVNEKMAKITIYPKIVDCRGYAPWVEENWLDRFRLNQNPVKAVFLVFI